MTFCAYGCGREAKYQLKNGKWICEDSKNKCPVLKRKNSLGGRNYKKEECQFCNKKYSQIKFHEKFCYLNPENLKLCPVCDKPIKDYKNTKTCSHKCANNLFKQTGEKHWNYQYGGEQYRKICFDNHGKKCIICGEENVVQAHHIDENSQNNNPENLVPLCLNHHWYMHTKYKNLIEDQVIKFIENFKRGHGESGITRDLQSLIPGSNPGDSTILAA